jgi:hypothetical protein
MHKSDFVPTFIMNLYKKTKIIRKFRGGGRRIETLQLHPSAKLGLFVY